MLKMNKKILMIVSLFFSGAILFSSCDCSGSKKTNDADIMNQLKDKDCDDCSKY